jgi:hypothetical protein
MRFNRYSRGRIVAYPFDGRGAIDLRRCDGTGLLRTIDGTPRAVIDRADVADVVAILSCVAEDSDQDACIARGVEVAA